MKIAVVIPCYRANDSVLDVLARLGDEVTAAYCVDDGCPSGSGRLVEDQCSDPRVRVLYRERNEGVGAATVSGYRAALADGADIIVKLDGDGQMDPALIPDLVQAIRTGDADYCKGNRFFSPDCLSGMPRTRLFGNAVLSFLTKLSSGYWNIFDPTNGFTAIHARVANALPLDRLAKGYFFESDMLFRLNTLRAVVVDVPMRSRYLDETSHLRVGSIIGPFLSGNLRNAIKRIAYNYYLRDFNLASVELVAGLVLAVFGTSVGASHWLESTLTGVPATAGTVMLAALPVLAGLQLLMGFLNFDVQNVPRTPLHPRLHPPSPTC
jgi:glycosyltransferase involved in cell wall biosynthesis